MNDMFNYVNQEMVNATPLLSEEVHKVIMESSF
jgi:hypothetical protein